jgi:hypothetical protein
MISRIIILISVIGFLLTGCSFAGKDTGLTCDEIKDLDKGRVVSPVTLLDDGGSFMISESEAGGDYRLLWVSSSGKVRKRISVPAKKIDYVAADSSGEEVVIYSQDKFSFLKLERRRSAWNMFACRQGTEPGFALYGGRKSRLFFSGKNLYALGYYYDRAGDYLNEWFVRINPEKNGVGAFEAMFQLSDPDRNLRKFYPEFKEASLLDITDKYALIKLSIGRQGCLVGYDIDKKEYFLIDQFSNFFDCSISRSNSTCAYIIQPKGSTFTGVLFIYDPVKRSSITGIPGIFFHPVFNKDGSMVAVGKNFEMPGNIRVPQIIVYSLKDNASTVISLPGGEKLFDWRFTGKNKLSIFTDRKIFQTKFSFKD